MSKFVEKKINDGALQSTPYVAGSAALFPDLITAFCPLQAGHKNC